MFMDEEHLYFSKEKQNLYNAHEIAQILPLAHKEMYDFLLSENSWIQNFLPQTHIQKIKKQSTFFWNFLRPFEYLCMLLQAMYMKRHKTRETTTSYVIAFHPIDYEKIVLKEYNTRVKTYAI